MFSQVENTPVGYIVSVYLRDVKGCGSWIRLRNFGDRQGDAIEFKDWDLPCFDLVAIRMFSRTFSVHKTYKRLGIHNYRLNQVSK